MPQRWTRAQIGYCAGTLLYFCFLFSAGKWQDLHPGNDFSSIRSAGPMPFTIICRFGPEPPFWRRTVSEAKLRRERQPYYLYLCAALTAAVFLRARRSGGTEPATRRRTIIVGSLFAGVLLLNLWFSLTLQYPRPYW